MKFLLQLPTLGRPQKLLDVLEKYSMLSSKEHLLIFNINCDKYDLSMNNDEIISNIHDIVDKYDHATANIHFDEDTNKIGAINSHIDGDFDILICLSDDMVPKIEKWDDIIAKNMDYFFPDTDG